MLTAPESLGDPATGPVDLVAADDLLPAGPPPAGAEGTENPC